MTYSQMPTCRLKNGLLVGNFSSGHQFFFDDGSVLGACENDRVVAGGVLVTEQSFFHNASNGFEVESVVLWKEITEQTALMLDDAHNFTNCDIIIVPLMLLECVFCHEDESGLLGRDRWKRCRSIRRTRRETTDAPSLIESGKFCTLL